MVEVKRILGVDPGDVHTGWAVVEWSNHGYFTAEVGVCDAEAIVLMAGDGAFDVAVLEDFRNYPGQGTWSQNLTSQLLGRLKSTLASIDVPYDVQLPAIKKVAKGHMRARGVHLVKPDTESRLYGHAYDAQYHAWYWLFRRGGRAIGGEAVQLGA